MCEHLISLYPHTTAALSPNKNLVIPAIKLPLFDQKYGKMENEVVIKSISSSSDTMQFMVVQNDTECIDNDVLTVKNDGLCDNKKEARVVHQNVSSQHASGQPQEFFRCGVCDVEFSTMGDLSSHANTLHLNAPSTKPLPKALPITKVSRGIFKDIWSNLAFC